MAHLDLQRGTYAAAETLLNGRTSRRIGHNTTLERCTGRNGIDDIAVRYHSTRIVTFSADGWLTMHTGGWSTVTTWSRINAILPGPWAVHSDRGTSWLYYSGRKVTPYVDGLAVHDASGAVGMSGDVLLTADDVSQIIAAADAAQKARDEKNAARMLREHPTAGGPRTHSRSLWNQRARDCDRCAVELAAIREAHTAAMHAEHIATTRADVLAMGSHRTVRDDVQWPTDPATGRTDYHAEPTHTPRVIIACPWDCPDRPHAY